jgi:AcrR family transcriptional regulator
MPRNGSASAVVATDARRRELLDAALTVFTRYGFRKTSMEEVARAARVSRQALYLHFSTKEELFQAALAQVLETSLRAASLQLNSAESGLEQKLTGAFDVWVGRFIGLLGSGASDLADASDTLGQGLVAEHEARFLDAVAKTLRSSGLARAYRSAGLSAPQLARTLQATARGLKHSCSTPGEFAVDFGHAVRALCWPLSDAK